MGGTVEVEEFDGFLSDWNDDVRPELEIAVGRGAGVTSLSARQVERGAGQVTLAVPCESGTCDLASAQPVALEPAAGADGVLVLEYRLEDFPLGTTTRTVELRSPQLTAPVTIAFEVTNRRSPFLIPLVVVVGLGLGWAVRKFLSFAIERARRNAARDELRERIDGIRGRYGDAELDAELENVRALLANGKITLAQVQEQERAVAQLLETANDKLETVHAEIRSLAASIVGTWDLPASISTPSTELKAAIDRAERALDERRTQGAQDELIVARNRESSLKDAAADWIGRYAHAARIAKDELAGLPSDGIVADVRRAVDEAVIGATLATDADLTTTLRTCSRVNEDWTRDVEPVVRHAVDQRASRAPQLARGIRRGLATGDPADRLAAVTTGLRDLLAVPAPAPATAAAQGDVERESSRQEVAEEETPSSVPTPILLPAYEAPRLDRLSATPRRALTFVVRWTAELVRFIILAAIVAAVTYGVSAPNWIGTAPQIIAIFGWAFAIDLTVQAVTATLGPASATPPTLQDD